MSPSGTWRLHYAPLSTTFSGRKGRLAGFGRPRLEDYEIIARRLVGTLNTIELHILRCLVSGMSNKDIAVEAGISIAEVERVRATTMKRLSAVRTADAVRIGLYAEVDLVT